MRLNPHIRYAATHHYFINKNYTNFCYDCRLFFIENGNGTALINNINYEISQNTIIYLPPKTEYNLSFKTNSVKIHILNFDLVDDYSNIKDSISLAKKEDFNPTKAPLYQIDVDFINPIVKNDASLRNNFLSCLDSFTEKEKFYQEVSSAKLKLLLIKLIKLNIENSSNKIVKSIIDLIKKEYQNHQLTNEFISLRYNYHPYHLNKLFKREIGVSLHKYLTNFRLEVAKNLLLTTNNSITEISTTVGFLNYAYFIKAFRERYKIPPLKYRKSNLEI